MDHTAKAQPSKRFCHDLQPAKRSYFEKTEGVFVASRPVLHAAGPLTDNQHVASAPRISATC